VCGLMLLVWLWWRVRWAGRRIRAWGPRLCGGVRCLYPRLALAGGCVMRRLPVLVVVLCRTGSILIVLSKLVGLGIRDDGCPMRHDDTRLLDYFKHLFWVV